MATTLNESLEQKVGAVRDHNSKQAVARLPTEILCCIFSEYINVHFSRTPFESKTPLVSCFSNANPTLLSQVCSKWRAVAVNLPTLWSSIFISIPAESHIYLVQLWLQRARDQPLDITLDSSRDLSSTRKILRAIVLRSQYWRKVDIKLSHYLVWYLRKLVVPPLRCDALQSVRLILKESFAGDFDPRPFHNTELETQHLRSIWSFFYTSTCLQDVAWIGDTDPEVYFHEGTPRRLKRIDSSSSLSLDQEQMVEFLGFFPELTHLRAEVASASRQYIPKLGTPSRPLTHQHLHTLHLYTFIPLSLVFSHITLPSLSELLIASLFHDGTLFDPPVLENFFLRSNCQLQVLKYLNRDMPETCLLRLLELPQLQSLLWLGCAAVTTDLTISAFLQTTEHNVPKVLPRLENLFLYSSNAGYVLLSEMISYRASLVKDFNFDTELEYMRSTSPWFY
ncbi:unnamed protein product [Cyclocybe aegerita]|uniref:F-box domain-containing protein n=1 Tax=Cyclocybe aegerita TaxID=1973307 RepID=A0A8S0XZA2_CYCAE|nr:unnamed protein product [Cyclocybe aegerita]